MSALDQFRQLPQDTRMRAYRIVDYDTKQWTFYEPRAAQLILREACRRHNRILVPKARRLGASTELEAQQFDALVMAEGPLPIAAMAHVDRAAKNIAGMLRGMYAGLPDEIRPATSKLNDSQLVLKDSGANQTVYMAGARGGTRSFAAGMGHLSEFDFYPDQAETLAEVDATVGDGLLVLESTINKPGSKFHDLCLGAPENGWEVVFLPWTLHPSYSDKVPHGFRVTAGEQRLIEEHGVTVPQVAWRRRQISSLGLPKFRREYPLTLAEAFATQAKGFFPVESYENAEIVQASPLAGFVELAAYIPGVEYSMGVDVAAGVGEDSSAVTVTDAGLREPVGHWRDNRVTPRDLPAVVLRLGRKYGWPMLVVESNVFGRRVIEDLERLGYPRRRMYLGTNGKPHRTHGGNRTGIFELVRATLQDGLVSRIHPWLLDEVKGCQWNEKRGRPDHAPGKHDDVLISYALSLLAAQAVPLRIPGERSSLSMEDRIRLLQRGKPQRATPFSPRSAKRRPM